MFYLSDHEMLLPGCQDEGAHHVPLTDETLFARGSIEVSGDADPQ